MQIVSPVDIEVAVATELAAAMTTTDVYASLAPENIDAGSLVVQVMGGAKQTSVSDSFDLIVYAYAATYNAAMSLGVTACSVIRELETEGAQASSVTFTTTEARPPYADPDPDRQTLRRVTVRAVVGARGTAL